MYLKIVPYRVFLRRLPGATQAANMMLGRVCVFSFFSTDCACLGISAALVA